MLKYFSVYILCQVLIIISRIGELKIAKILGRPLNSKVI